MLLRIKSSAVDPTGKEAAGQDEHQKGHPRRSHSPGSNQPEAWVTDFPTESQKVDLNYHNFLTPNGGLSSVFTHRSCCIQPKLAGGREQARQETPQQLVRWPRVWGSAEPVEPVAGAGRGWGAVDPTYSRLRSNARS